MRTRHHRSVSWGARNFNGRVAFTALTPGNYTLSNGTDFQTNGDARMACITLASEQGRRRRRLNQAFRNRQRSQSLELVSSDWALPAGGAEGQFN